jgi:transposase
MFLSHLDKASFSLFLQHLHQHLLSKTAGKILLIGDGASAHTSQDWTSQPLHWQKLPTACPELNPVERFFEELRAQTANRIFQNKDELEKRLEKLILDWQRQPEKVKQLTYFPYLRLSA